MLTTAPTAAQLTHLHQNAAVLANIVELVCASVRQCANTEVQDALGDDSLNKDVLAFTVSNYIQERLINAQA